MLVVVRSICFSAAEKLYSLLPAAGIVTVTVLNVIWFMSLKVSHSLLGVVLVSVEGGLLTWSMSIQSSPISTLFCIYPFQYFSCFSLCVSKVVSCRHL